MITIRIVSCFSNMEAKSVNMIRSPKSDTTFCSIFEAKEKYLKPFKLRKHQQKFISQDECESNILVQIARKRLNEINQILYDHHRGILYISNEEMKAMLVEIEETMKTKVHLSQKLRNATIADCHYIKKIVSCTQPSTPALQSHQTEDIFVDTYIELPSLQFGQISQHSKQQFELSTQNSDTSSNLLSTSDYRLASNLNETPNVLYKIHSSPLCKYTEEINEKLKTSDTNLVITNSSKPSTAEDNEKVLKDFHCNTFDSIITNEGKRLKNSSWLSKRSHINLQKSQSSYVTKNDLISNLNESRNVEKNPKKKIRHMNVNKEEKSFNKRRSSSVTKVIREKPILNLSSNSKTIRPQTPNILALLHNEILFNDALSQETQSEESFDIDRCWKHTKQMLQEAKNAIGNISNSDLSSISDFEDTISEVKMFQKYGSGINSPGVTKFCLTNNNVAKLADRLSLSQKFLESTIQSIIIEDTGYSSDSKISYVNASQSPRIYKHHINRNVPPPSGKFFSNFFYF